MKKVLLIPFFGKFPNYFQLFLNSCSYNYDFDFKIFTDQEYNRYNYANNVIFYKISFQEFQMLAQKKLKTKEKIISPYKLCDYKPTYGRIFEDYTNEYEYWGYCDVDLIFGNISKFLPDKTIKDYEKIQIDGHLTLYKNCEKMNNLYKKSNNKIIPFSKVIRIKEPCYFDEIQFETICKENKILEFVNYSYADILPSSFYFKMAENGNIKNFKNQVFYFDKGKVIRKYFQDNDEIVDELMYIHLQKRKMKININQNKEFYFINPNNFHTQFYIDNTNVYIYKLKYYFNVIKKININWFKIKINVQHQKKVVKKNNEKYHKKSIE